jgi:hypothetical protein
MEDGGWRRDAGGSRLLAAVAAHIEIQGIAMQKRIALEQRTLG